MPRSTQDIIAHADDLAADRFEAATPNPLAADQHDAATAVRDAVIARGHAEAQLVAVVTRARATGVTWDVLGAILGTSGEAARQRYGSSAG